MYVNIVNQVHNAEETVFPKSDGSKLKRANRRSMRIWKVGPMYKDVDNFRDI